MENLIDLFVLITTMSVYLMNMDFKYPKTKMILIFIIFGVVSFSLYNLLLSFSFERETMSSICFSIPSLLLCLWTSKYKGARFIFTFAVIDLVGMTAVILGRCFSILFDYNITIIFVSTIILLALYLLGAAKFRNKYLEILRTVKTGWGYMALAVMLLYVFTFVLIGYPTPIYTRREYVPTILVFIAVIAAILKVIFEAAGNNIKIYNEKMEKENLKMKLELNQVHYDMAYKDRLSGVKNRNAFEEYLDGMEHDTDKEIICVSFDLDNLKTVNDEIGHHAGDELIRKVGYLLREVFGEEENMFRIGGDEFVVISENLGDTWIADKFNKMDIISRKIRSDMTIPFEYARGVSYGRTSDIRELLKKADEIMYVDKNKHKGGAIHVCHNES